jgi:hypothetical protein
MNDVIITVVGLLIAGGALLALQHWLANVNRQRAEMTEEEYEESRNREPGLIGAGLMAFDQTIFHRSAEQAIERRIDAEQGHLPGGGGGQGEKLPPDSEQDDASPSTNQ